MFQNVTHWPPLYKRGSKGEIRVWRMDVGMNSDDDAGHRVVSGIKDGTMTTTDWTVTQPTNVGRANARTPHAQAEAEVAALYELKQKRGYFRYPEDVDKVEFTKPMLAKEWEERKHKIDWRRGLWLQAKLDGIRCIARPDSLWTRSGERIVTMGHIAEPLSEVFQADPDQVPFDGELYNHELNEEFRKITSLVRRENATPEQAQMARDLIQYHTYDLIDPHEPFSARYERLLGLYQSGVMPLRCVLVEATKVHSLEEMDAFYEKVMAEGYEGVIARVDAPYEHKRSWHLLKRKDEWITEEFPVIRMEEGLGGWSGKVKRFIVQLPNGNTNDATPVGTMAELKELWESGKTPDWATVRYFKGYTPDGHLRFPTARDWGYGARKD